MPGCRLAWLRQMPGITCSASQPPRCCANRIIASATIRSSKLLARADQHLPRFDARRLDAVAHRVGAGLLTSFRRIGRRFSLFCCARLRAGPLRCRQAEGKAVRLRAQGRRASPVSVGSVMTPSSWSWRRFETMGTRSSLVSVAFTQRPATRDVPARRHGRAVAPFRSA